LPRGNSENRLFLQQQVFPTAALNQYLWISHRLMNSGSVLKHLNLKEGQPHPEGLQCLEQVSLLAGILIFKNCRFWHF
jgi:hypothetical protein